jgi:hypothetical protein
MKWYSKELPDAPVYVNGFPLRFDFLATEDPTLIAELDKCAHRGMGGVVSITQEEYEVEVKKKDSSIQSSNSLNPPPHRTELQAFHRVDAKRVAEAVANPASRRGMFARPQTGDRPVHQNQQESMPDPIQIPSPNAFVVPPTAKLSDLKK